VDPAVPGVNYKVDVPLVGDARLCLAALNEALDGYTREGDLSFLDGKKRAKFESFDSLAASDETPVKPERVVKELSRVLDGDALLVADPGTPCPYFSAYHVQRGTGRRYFSNRAHGALGYALAASAAAHFARP